MGQWLTGDALWIDPEHCFKPLQRQKFEQVDGKFNNVIYIMIHFIMESSLRPVSEDFDDQVLRIIWS